MVQQMGRIVSSNRMDVVAHAGIALEVHQIDQCICMIRSVVFCQHPYSGLARSFNNIYDSSYEERLAPEQSRKACLHPHAPRAGPSSHQWAELRFRYKKDTVVTLANPPSPRVQFGGHE